MHSCIFILLSFAFQLNVFCVAVNLKENYRGRKMQNNDYPMTSACDGMGNQSAQFLNLFMPMKGGNDSEKKVSLTTFPEFFDVREKFGKRCPLIRRVYNQGQCKSGWAVAIASVISDRICISSVGKKQIMLSAQNLLNCCPDCCGCNGGIILNAWKWVKDNGIVSGSAYQNNKSCMPYMIPPAHPTKYMESGFGGEWATENLALPDCSKLCKDGRPRKVTKIKGFQLWSKLNHFDIMEQLMMYGPLQVSMHVFEDFRYYKKGLYTHQTGKFEGDHAVKLIGWGILENTRYWLAINSFGNSSWGMNGTFMVPWYGDDNTDFGYAIISPKLTTNRAFGINFFKQNMFICFLIILLYFR